MVSAAVQKRALELREAIRHHDRLYYIESRTEVSDSEYDKLFRELVQLEEQHAELVTPDSPTQRVGAPLPEGQGFEKVAHEVPMLSIDSLFGAAEVREFEERILRFLKLESGDELDWAVEPKFDGVSASLLYEGGTLVRGLTRGDGNTGEDVTANLRTVRNIPLRLTDDRRPLPALLEVRGEVLIARDAFARFNVEREERGQPTLANPRNATSGALRRNDPAEVARYPLEFHTWAITRLESAETFTTHSEMLGAVQEWGLPDSGYGRTVRGLEACLAYHDDLEARRFEVPFEMDGIVAKLDQLALRERLGRTARAMRWQFAHKFAPVEATSVLRAIEVQVGANGRLTPRAHVDPVEVGGVTVRHTTLHNADHVAKLGVRVGDMVFLERAGDVIPQVMGVAKPAQGKAPADWRDLVPEELLDDPPAEAADQPAAKGAGKAGPTTARRVRPGVLWKWREAFQMPAECPACGTTLSSSGKYWSCPNRTGCAPQIIGRTEVLTGRTGFDIDRLGKKLIRQLVEAGMVASPADVFHLDPEALLELERWGKKSVDNLMRQLEERRQVPFDRYLVGLGIPEVGTATARLIARNYRSLEDFVAADVEELQMLDGIGPEVAESVRRYFADPASQELMQRLRAGGVLPVYPDPASSNAEGVFSGKVLVFTGTLEQLSRAEAKALAEELGARVASSISKKTDFLVIGGNPGSKRKKAEELGVSVLTEPEFLKQTGRA